MNINNINPNIISPQEELDEIIREYITPDKLRKITGINNLNEVKCIELKVDSRKTSIGNVGKILPNLFQLNLNNSYFNSIRNLGSSFDKLKILWACNCSINELDGITSFNSLKKLYLNKNSISDLYLVTMLDDLEMLNIENNMISKVEQLEYLALCSSLNNLTIQNNPITSKLKLVINENKSISKQNKLNAYNQIIHTLAPSITTLDGLPIDAKKLNVLTDEEIRNILKKADDLAIDIANNSNIIYSNKYYEMENEEASELTYGTSETVCGNPALFLRSRKQELKQINEKEKKESDIKINNYVEEKENKVKSYNEKFQDNKDIENENCKDKKVTENIIEKESVPKKVQNDTKKKLNHKITTKKSRLPNNPNIQNSENITENNDIYETITENDEININSNIIKQNKINSHMKKERKLKHRRSQTCNTTSRSISLTNSSISSSSFLKPLKPRSEQPTYSVESIYSISSSECSSSSESKPHSKLCFHRRSSTTGSGLDINKLTNSTIKDFDDLSLSNGSIHSLRNESIRKLNPLKNEYNRAGLNNNILNDSNGISMKNNRNVFTRKINYKNYTQVNNNEIDNHSFINNKKESILIPHPPLNPIPNRNDNLPISVPKVLRRIYKK